MSRFSLIVPTIHRTVEVERLLTSLQDQNESFEVLIVDQNPDSRLIPIIERFTGRLNLVRFSSSRGLSRAKNVGLEAASGEIVAFPDDDAWYPPGLLTRVNELLPSSPEFAGISARATDADGRSDAGIRWYKRPTVIDRFNIWRTSIEFTMFLRRDAVSGLRFNEELDLGAGTPWGSGSGTDLLLRLLNRGYKVAYEPRLIVHHPSHLSHPPSEEKALSYARGLGRVLRLNGYPLTLAAILCLRPLARAATQIARLDFKGAALSRRIAFSRSAGYYAKL
jgi:glycosyltransferase involved in cell wall biosynthesis